MPFETDDFEASYAETDFVFLHLFTLSQLVSELFSSCSLSIYLSLSLSFSIFLSLSLCPSLSFKRFYSLYAHPSLSSLTICLSLFIYLT
jgi:hypothetical protein